jgi:hypothetical protein
MSNGSRPNVTTTSSRMKGTMSEAEIHWLRRRLQGARQHKARRGALKMPASTGYQWGERGFELDPDEAVQRAVRVVFHRYDVEPSAWAVLRWRQGAGNARSSAGGDSSVVESPADLAPARHTEEPIYAGVCVQAPPEDPGGRKIRCVRPGRAIRIVVGESRARIRVTSPGRGTCRIRRSCGRTWHGWGTRVEGRRAKGRPCCTVC